MRPPRGSFDGWEGNRSEFAALNDWSAQANASWEYLHYTTGGPTSMACIGQCAQASIQLVNRPGGANCSRPGTDAVQSGERSGRATVERRPDVAEVLGAAAEARQAL